MLFWCDFGFLCLRFPGFRDVVLCFWFAISWVFSSSSHGGFCVAVAGKLVFKCLCGVGIIQVSWVFSWLWGLPASLCVLWVSGFVVRQGF